MRRLFYGGLLAMACALRLRAAEPGEEAVVVFNARLGDSRAVAAHYASVRHVPARQVLGLKLPTGENMTREEYRDELQMPLLNFLERERLFVFEPRADPPGSGRPRTELKEARIRYAVLCYGVPLRILEDAALSEPDESRIPAEIRGRNGAAVDSELTLLPWSREKVRRDGWQRNPCYAATNAALLNPTNGVLIVARLDGPEAGVAMRLVDKAMEAETNGLWGRAYFDLRGLTNGALKEGDDWIGSAAKTARRYGFETVVDERPETFSAGFPMSQIALYAGWYDGNVSGPFTRLQVEMMPGAFAYHLHSYSAHTLRTTNQNWCGPLLALGATATMGCIDEPYLQATPDLGVFFSRWLIRGFTYGEAACAAQQAVCWQTTVVGDPLYRPFGKDPRALHEELIRRHSPLVEWSDLRWVDVNLAAGAAAEKYIQFLETEASGRQSAILSEKLADLDEAAGKPDLAIKAFRQALAFHPTPQTRVRLMLALGDLLVASGQEPEALKLYNEFQKNTPDYPEALALWQKMRTLAEKLGKNAQAARYADEINKLSPVVNP
jgi:uncharacterized protein (TIGR03790 family)